LSEFGLPQRQLAATGANAYGSIQWNDFFDCKDRLVSFKNSYSVDLDAPFCPLNVNLQETELINQSFD
jgi:hypothetical protein